MGFLSSLLPVIGSVAGNAIAPGIGGAIGGALGGALGGSGSSQTGTATTTQQQQLDPRIANIVFGSNGNNGLLSQYQSYLNQPQSQALQNYGAVGNDYLNNHGAANLDLMTNSAGKLLNGNAAPTTSPSAWAVGSQVQAPNQNNIDLTGSYQSLLSGGNNQALRDSLQYGTDLTGAQFQKNQTDLTNNLMRNVLPSIGSSSVLAGQYGGSRQGIAEGNALSDYTNQLTNANTQLGLANSANTTGQLANSYEQGQNRALSATQGLGAQQYGVAQQDAATKNAAEFMNVGNVQQSNLANQGAQLQTNAQNNAAAATGAGLLGGLNSDAYGLANNDQNYGINRAGQVNGLLAPYLTANQSSTTSQPLYGNATNNLLGGGLLGGLLTGGSGGSGAGSALSSLFDGNVGNSLFKSLGLGSSL